MNKLKTDQEKFWVGEFGDDYIERNKGQQLVASNLHLFSTILARCDSIKSIIEFGSNIGLNLIAIKQLLPKVELSAIEINVKAANACKKNAAKVYVQSVLDFVPDYQRDFVFTKGLLIHIHPKELTGLYDVLYKTSKRYVCFVEYYNPTPLEVVYRGYKDKLFKRDFAGEFCDRHPDVRITDYGFVYHRDAHFPQDDANWFLLEKKL